MRVLFLLSLSLLFLGMTLLEVIPNDSKDFIVSSSLAHLPRIQGDDIDSSEEIHPVAFVLSGNSSNGACPSGKYSDSLGNCQNCNELCRTCVSASLCSDCSKALSFNETQCLDQCPASSQPIGSNKKCTCNSGYVLSNSICKLYQNTACPDGTYSDSDGKCVNCNAVCKTCTSATLCSSCAFAMSFDETQCLTNCPAHSSPSGTNKKCYCDYGYYQSSSVCLSCQTACKSCSQSSGSCYSCYDGYYLSGNNCYSCRTGCKTCSGYYNCYSCQEGYEYNWGDCNLIPTPPSKVPIVFEVLGAILGANSVILIIYYIVYLCNGGRNGPRNQNINSNPSNPEPISENNNVKPDAKSIPLLQDT